MLRDERSIPGDLEFGLASDLEYDYKNFTQSKILYEKAAARGHKHAQFNLGLWYLEGTRPGTRKDLVKARELFQASADQGVGMSMYNLGTLYEKGEGGLPKDEIAAFKLYKRALKEGKEWPQDGQRRVFIKLSQMYAEGRGTRKDVCKAAEWMAKGQKESELPPGFLRMLNLMQQLDTGRRQESADDKWRKMCHYIDNLPEDEKPTTYKKWEDVMKKAGYVPANPTIRNKRKKNCKCNFPEFMELCGGIFNDLATYELKDAPLPPAKCEYCNVEESEERKLKRCGRCQERYCSKECQQKDWKDHKKVCDRVVLSNA